MTWAFVVGRSLPAVQAAVLHGGQGTVQTACATGIPFVGIGLQPEQVWNVDTCVAQGNAIALSPRRATTPALVDAVRRVLAEPAFGVAAQRVRHAFAAEDGAAAAARIVEAELGDEMDIEASARGLDK